MDNFKTIEVRWFYPGVLPDELLAWFDTLGEPLANADNRTDVYLESSSPDLGVKLRQGNLEVKYRQAILGAISIEGFKTSQVEQWTKWICVDDSSGLTPEKFVDKSGWIAVGKTRYQRLYQVQFSDLRHAPLGVQIIPIPKPQDGAAAIEITQLQVAEQNWWTIACEYLGDKIEIDLQFSPLVKLLLSTCPLPVSTPSISCGYPQWSIETKASIRISTD